MTVASLSEGASSKISVEDSKFLESIVKNTASENVSIAVESGLKGEALDTQKMIQRNREALYTTIVNHGVDSHLKNDLDAPKFNALEELYNKLDKTDQDEQTPHEEIIAEVLKKGVGAEHGFNDEDSNDLIADIMEQIPSEFFETNVENLHVSSKNPIEKDGNRTLNNHNDEIAALPTHDLAYQNQDDGLPTISEEDMDGIGMSGAMDFVAHFCFVKGTLISTDEGLIPIETVRIGTEVRSCDTDQMNCTLKKVTKLYESYTDSLIKIRIAGSEIVTTPNHPFYVYDYHGFLPAERLQVGDLLVAENQKLDPIEGIQRYTLAQHEKVYNLEIEDLHNYYVRGRSCASSSVSDSSSSGNYLVHNCGGVTGISLEMLMQPLGGYDRVGLHPDEIITETTRRELEREEWLASQRIAVAPDPGLFRRGARWFGGRNSNSKVKLDRSGNGPRNIATHEIHKKDLRVQELLGAKGPSQGINTGNLKYADRVRARAVQDPKAHNFPHSYDREIIQSSTPVLRKDGSLQYNHKGSMSGKEGVFEITINPETGTIFHRNFRPNR